MFFNTKNEYQKKLAAEKAALEEMTSKRRQEIRGRLAEVDNVNHRLRETVKETQVISVALIGKLKKELKVAKKTLTGMTRRLKEGVVLINHIGDVIQLNPAGEKLFGVKEEDFVGKNFKDSLGKVIQTKLPDGQPLGLKASFYSELSAKIFESVKKYTNGQKLKESNRIFKETLPHLIQPDTEVPLTVKCADGKNLKLNFMFSILDNDPEDVSDITYVYLFSRCTKIKSAADKLKVG